MGLRFDPVGGGQFKQALNAIVEAESQPIKTLEKRKAGHEARSKLFQEFKGKFSGFEKTLNDFSNFKSFREFKADLGDGANFVSVTIDKDKAEPGSYSIEVGQLAARTAVLSNSFEDPDDRVLGVGFVIAKQTDGENAEIFIDDEHSSLRGIAQMINQQQKLPIHASVVKDMSDPEKPWRLIVSSKKDGEGGQVEIPDFYFIDGNEDFYVSDRKEAENAQVTVDGFPIEAESNLIKDFVQGVNLTLKQANPGKPITLNITQDYQKVSGKVKGLIDQVNGILEFINKQNQVDEKSDTKNTFAGDTSLQTIEYRLRNLLHEGFPVGDPDSEKFKFAFLNEMGVSFLKNGLLEFKEDRFNKLLENDFDSISEAITGPHGFANQLKQVVSTYVRPGDGLLAIRDKGLRDQIKRVDDEIANKARRLEQKKQSLTEQFSRLEATLSGMQRQQQYLSAAMPSGGGGNLVSQLLGG